METRSCPNCGAAVEPGDAFCKSCGRPLAGDPWPLRYWISPTRVVVMSVLSWGLYLFYWFYLTWKQYRDHTREEAYPVWHALTLLVPIYGYFRMHAHVRTFDELMHSASISSTLSRGGAVFALVVLSILDTASFRLALGDVTGGVAFALVLIDAVAVAITIVLTPITSSRNYPYQAAWVQARHHPRREPS